MFFDLSEETEETEEEDDQDGDVVFDEKAGAGTAKVDGNSVKNEKKMIDVADESIIFRSKECHSAHQSPQSHYHQHQHLQGAEQKDVKAHSTVMSYLANNPHIISAIINTSSSSSATTKTNTLSNVTATSSASNVKAIAYTAVQSTNFSSSSSGRAISSLPSHSHVPPSYAPPSYGPWPTISFSLINTKEFTAKASTVVSRDVISTIKLVSGVRFDTQTRKFIFPIACHGQLVTALGSMKVHVEPLPQDSRNRLTMQRRMESSFCSEEFGKVLTSKLPPKLLNALAQFQREGVMFVYKNQGRAIIADEMGLGKTIQAIACAGVYQEAWPVLVVAPSSARHHWKMELETWLCPDVIAPEDILLIDSPAKSQMIGKTPHKFAILSYNLLTRLEDSLCEKGYQMIILDESHFLKNGKAKRTKSMTSIAEGASRVLLLTGTPALSRPYELYTQLHIIAPLSWTSEQNFCRRYCQGKGVRSGRSWGVDTKGASNTEELHAMLFGTIMIRRLKKDMLTGLPPKARHIVKVAVRDDAQREYLLSLLNLIEISKGRKSKRVQEKKVDCDEDSQEKQRRRDVTCSVPDFSLPASVYTVTTNTIHRSTSPPATLQSEEDAVHEDTEEDNYDDLNDKLTFTKEKRLYLMELFNKSGIAKVDMVLDHVDAFLADRMSGKLLIFAHHKVVLDRISDFLLSKDVQYIRIDGSTPSKARHQKMIEFQTVPSCRVGVLAITAAGVAITLTAASTVFFAELFWTPGSLLQAEDRVHRIGQLSPVHVKYFLGTGTVDDLLWPLIQKKMKTLGELFEGEQNVELVTHSEVEEDKTSQSQNPDVAQIVDEISLEEEQKIIQRETEEGYDEDDNGDDVNLVSASSSSLLFSEHQKGTGAEEDSRSTMGGGNNGMSFTSSSSEEFDGLAETMMLASKYENNFNENNCLLIDVDDEETGKTIPPRADSKNQVVDLVNDDDDDDHGVITIDEDEEDDDSYSSDYCSSDYADDSDDFSRINNEEYEDEYCEVIEETGGNSTFDKPLLPRLEAKRRAQDVDRPHLEANMQTSDMQTSGDPSSSIGESSSTVIVVLGDDEDGDEARDLKRRRVYGTSSPAPTTPICVTTDGGDIDMTLKNVSELNVTAESNCENSSINGVECVSHNDSI